MAVDGSDTVQQMLIRDLLQMFFEGCRDYVYDRTYYYVGQHTHTTFFRFAFVGVVAVVVILMLFYMAFRIACLILPRPQTDVLIVGMLIIGTVVGSVLFLYATAA